MKRSRRSWWLAFAACAALALAALGWITHTVLGLERAEERARAQAAHQEALRLALWRMDSWLGPQLAREAARPIHEYLAYYAQERAYTRILNVIEPGEVLTPSPLVEGGYEFFPFYFQLDANGTWSSPQVPEGNWLDLAESSPAGAERIRAARGELDRLAARTSLAELSAALARGEAELAAVIDEPLFVGCVSPGDAPAIEPQQQLKNQLEFSKRAQTSYDANEEKLVAAPAAGGDWTTTGSVAISVGPLVPVWLPAGADVPSSPELCFVRRVRGGSGAERLQGFRVDWARLATELEERARDLLPVSSLVPASEDERRLDASGLFLATIPARLSAPAPPPAPLRLNSPARATLALSWIAALVALIAAAMTLAASISFGERRSRFASTVTHELRTPLTTFRMYSEMLARKMVPPEKEPEYLATLERESERLSTLVENVLAYARLEDGRAPLRRERIAVRPLLERALPELERRAREAGTRLDVALDGVAELELDTDPEAVRQILFNLVDNACKYGRSANGDSIEIEARASGERIELRVRDHGPGVPPRVARAIFQPFERGGRPAADPIAGVGLGLALSRGLARDLGGDLTLDEARGEGAAFRLSLRRA